MIFLTIRKRVIPVGPDTLFMDNGKCLQVNTEDGWVKVTKTMERAIKRFTRHPRKHFYSSDTVRVFSLSGLKRYAFKFSSHSDGIDIRGDGVARGLNEREAHENARDGVARDTKSPRDSVNIHSMRLKRGR